MVTAQVRWAAIVIVVGMSVAPGTAYSLSPEPAVLLAEDFATAPDWTFTGMWHPHSRDNDPTGAAYFGFENEDIGIFNPDNLERCEDNPCEGELRSSWLTLPADRPFFLYVRSHNILGGFHLLGSEATTVRIETESGTEPLYEAAPYSDFEAYKADLSAYRGQTIRLAFVADSTGYFWAGGWAIDDVVVTDEDLDVIRTLVVEGKGPAVLAELQLAPGQTVVVRYSYAGLFPDVGRHLRLVEVDGDVQGSSRATYNIHYIPFEDAHVGAADAPAVGLELGGSLDPIMKIDTFRVTGYSEPTTVRIAAAAVGIENLTYRFVFETVTGLDALGATVGGEEILAVTARDVPASVFIGANDETVLLEDGHVSANTSGEALGWFEMRGGSVEATASTPTGPAEIPESFSWETQSGAWRLDIDRIREGSPGHLAAVVELPRVEALLFGGPTQEPPTP